MMTFTSPYETNALSRPFDLVAEVPFETGITELSWEYEDAQLPAFLIFTDNELIGTTEEQTYGDQLPDYGVFTYSITAAYEDDGESGACPMPAFNGGALNTPVEPASLYQIYG